MKKVITAVSLSALLSLMAGCGGGGGGDSAASDSNGTTTTASNNNGNTGGSGEESRVTSTAEIVTTPEFDFSASRSVDINFDVPEARNVEGMLSLCSKYADQGDGTFDIDYNSCTVQATLVNGVYNAKMELTNDVDSVVGVVWFTDPAVSPVYKEFSVATTTAGRGFGASGVKQNPVIVWN